MTSFKKVKQNAWLEYQFLRTTPLFLEGRKVVFSRRGWNHITGRSKDRVLKQIVSRLILVHDINRILKDASSSISTNQNFVAVENVHKNRIIRIVFLINQDNNLVFLSILRKR